MTDSIPSSADDEEENGRQLLIVFMGLAVLTLLITLYSCCSRLWGFLSRYCFMERRQGCCRWKIRIDWDGYRQERQSLQRLRAQRRALVLNLVTTTTTNPSTTTAIGTTAAGHTTFVTTYPVANNNTPTTDAMDGSAPMAAPQHPFQTFTQIPGPIPSTWPNQMGFILVRPNGTATATTTAAPDSDEIQHRRSQLSKEERRAFLERIVSSREYHKDENDEENQEPSGSVDVEEGTAPATGTGQCEETERQEEDGHDEQQQPASSIVFPAHEEPSDYQSMCAICLDTFREGDRINDARTCVHMFHTDCLLEWLEMHDVCPCCRIPMIQADQWRQATATTATLVIREERTTATLPSQPTMRMMYSRGPSRSMLNNSRRHNNNNNSTGS